MARFMFEVESSSFERTVAVAHADLLCNSMLFSVLCNRVLFSVPMDGSMARKSLLGAVDTSVEIEAGHSGNTSDTESSTLVGVVVAPDTEKVKVEASEVVVEPAEKPVNVVTTASSMKLVHIEEEAEERDCEYIAPLICVPNRTEEVPRAYT